MDDLIEDLNQNKAVILPTETVYGIFAKALNEKAVDSVYQLKQRPRDKAMNLNISSYEDIVRFSSEQPIYLKKLVSAFLPGPLTIILKANQKVPVWINSGLKSVGFRMPNHPKTLAIIKKCGPLIGPSANISGQESGKYFKKIRETFGEHINGLEDDCALTGKDSTILDLSGDKALILRQGAITKSELLREVPELEF
ncbi:Sua5/YciO/YrdC/YwlC family protein [Streptococcus urinalis FB127-CNA-2]|uniref:L-threonylcarbamoyladenylate synthase n=1 Tax=Streptococcus urinalis 2285-97 TaxID=764291 RepID=G5KFU1_9STRE|nr:L-threonylcarbamoyladenylate synthase [Streptococcus urinalis]EHJ56342.1 Sua5/YciO/YrdC/YwlC family protein [Streptococcus urinalis 2285-97]EKS22152.1 Sua5/YciO/YrdC/YwlC family protein [Streptococcus urinalis FB127-CNA-2]VEF31964.1 putative translation factor [Streptococcus urinalis]